MSKRKICVVITARPSYSRIKSALDAIKDHSDLELQLVITGSALLEKYGSVIDFIESDGFTISEKVYVVVEGEGPNVMAKTTGLAVLELANVFYNLKPDIVIVIADRFETLAVSIAASYQNICLAHVQGGEVTGNIDEKVRHANTKLANIHLVATEDARKRVIQLGEDPEYVHNTGCPSIDIASEVLQSPNIDFNPLTKYNGVGNPVNCQDDYLVVLQHSVTSEFASSREQIFATLNAIHDLKIPTFWFWPNVDSGSDEISAGIRSFREKFNSENIYYFKSMDPKDFLKLIYNSKCLIGNSSVGIRESSYLGIPVVNIGTRQQRRARGKNVIDVDNDKDAIMNAIKKQLTIGKYDSNNIYGDANSGKKIAEVLAKSPLSSHKTIMY
jgi:bifunctional UDP-N-acetylglucosamine 2-epimerase / N-acetylmannosamine kinase